MEDDVSGNIVAYLRKRGTFDSFSEDSMPLLLELMWNKVECVLEDSRKAAVRLRLLLFKSNANWVEWKNF